MHFGWVFSDIGWILGASGFAWTRLPYTMTESPHPRCPKTKKGRIETPIRPFLILPATRMLPSPESFLTQIQRCFIIPSEAVFQVITGIDIPAVIFFNQHEGMPFCIFP